MVAGIRKTPIFEHPLEAPSGQIGLRHPLRDISQSETGQSRIQHLRRGVEDELTFDADL